MNLDRVSSLQIQQWIIQDTYMYLLVAKETLLVSNNVNIMVSCFICRVQITLCISWL